MALSSILNPREISVLTLRSQLLKANPQKLAAVRMRSLIRKTVAKWKLKMMTTKKMTTRKMTTTTRKTMLLKKKMKLADRYLNKWYRIQHRRS